MFERLKAWFKKDECFGIYSIKERLIFKYTDGTKMISADPMVIYRKISDEGPEMLADMKVATSPLKDAGAAQLELVSKIRRIFQLRPFEDGGLTEIECLHLLNAFFAYAGSIKKNSSHSPTPSTSSEDYKLTSEESQPISNSSASGSTEGASNTEEQEPLPPESPSP